MDRHNGQCSYLVLPEDLIAFAWSAPMRDLAAKIGISDVGLKKLLNSLGIVTPPQGHWNKVHAGKKVLPPPRVKPRRAGETGRLRVDSRFVEFVAEAKPIPASGPFATAAVPEDLEELRAQELKAIGNIAVPRNLDSPHAGMRRTVEQEKLRRLKDIERPYNWDSPKFDNPVGLRTLKLLNGIFLALAKRGHGGDAGEHNSEISARVRIGERWMGLSVDILGKHRTVLRQGYQRPDPALPASTPLILRLKPGFDREVSASWQDEAGRTLESKLAEISAALIAAGEANFRQGLKEREDRLERERIERAAKAEQDRIDRENRRIAQLEHLNKQRITDLQRSGELLRLSQDIRSLVVQVREATRVREDIDAATLEAWEHWALDEANRLDPVASGQIFSHLRPPSLDQADEQ